MNVLFSMYFSMSTPTMLVIYYTLQILLFHSIYTKKASWVLSCIALSYCHSLSLSLVLDSTLYRAFVDFYFVNVLVFCCTRLGLLHKQGLRFMNCVVHFVA